MQAIVQSQKGSPSEYLFHNYELQQLCQGGQAVSALDNLFMDKRSNPAYTEELTQDAI